jgi:hypothetical protein
LEAIVVDIWTKRSKVFKFRGLETPPVLEGIHDVAVWYREVVEGPLTLGKERMAEGSAGEKRRSSGEESISTSAPCRKRASTAGVVIARLDRPWPIIFWHPATPLRKP